MPITKGAKKALRAADRRRIFNLRRARSMNAAIKNVQRLSTEGKKSEAATLLPHAYKTIDKALKRGVIKANNAARKKSRLAHLVAQKS